MSSPPDLWGTALQMAVALVLMGGLLALLLYISRRMARYRFGGASSNLMRVLETRYLAVKKSVTLLQVPGAVLIIGISDNDMRLLDKISDPELVRQLDTQPQDAIPLSFSAHLEKIKHRLGKKPA